MEANVEYTFDDDEHIWNSSIRHVIGPEKCCALCQGTKRCKVWSWVKNAGPYKNWYVCFLKGGSPTGKRMTNGIISGVPPQRLSLKMQAKVEGPKNVSLYCFSLMRPGSEEVQLLKAQEAHGASIFACNECMIYSNRALQIGSLTTSVINSDLKCTSGGDFGKALNSWIFIEVWRKVIEDGRYYQHDWTVKVDPDAVFFPPRLQSILQDHREAGYVNNCKEGMHGAIEVLSRRAVGALAWDYRASPNKTYPRNCVAAQQLSRWGEDMFLDKCLMDTLSIKRAYDDRLLCEGSCGCPDWYWCLNGTSRATFHPFKSPDTYTNCLANALHGGAVAMPPTPEPCAGPQDQCGGRGWRGPTCCENGYVCRVNNTWYSQCQRSCAAPLEQCGGKHWKGVTCCLDGYDCTKKDKWYSQCRPHWAPVMGSHDNDNIDDGDHGGDGGGGGGGGGDDDDDDDDNAAHHECAKAEKQCGGHDYDGPACCPRGYTCRRKDKWYSQCKREGSRQPLDAAVTSSSCSGPGRQCGGIDYNGSTCCTPGYTCQAKNHWYSACSVKGASATLQLHHR